MLVGVIALLNLKVITEEFAVDGEFLKAIVALKVAPLIEQERLVVKLSAPLHLKFCLVGGITSEGMVIVIYYPLERGTGGLIDKVISVSSLTTLEELLTETEVISMPLSIVTESSEVIWSIIKSLESKEYN